MADSVAPPTASYPVRLSVDYPDQPRNRLTVLLRLFTVIPIAIVLWALVGSPVWAVEPTRGGVRYLGATGSGLFIAVALMVLFRQKYPRWWFDWSVQLTKFGGRVGAYFALLRDEYPSTDEEQAVHIEITYPDAKKDLNRWLPLVKWFLAIPHYFVLLFLFLAVIVTTIIAWFAILFTGKYPEGLFNFAVGVWRWGLRVSGYMGLLVTDRYPPFSMDP